MSIYTSNTTYHKMKLQHGLTISVKNGANLYIRERYLSRLIREYLDLLEAPKTYQRYFDDELLSMPQKRFIALYKCYETDGLRTAIVKFFISKEVKTIISELNLSNAIT